MSAQVIKCPYKLNGQAHQDLFAIKLNADKRNSHFVEIGSQNAIRDNNSYMLEKDFGWRGIMVEYDGKYEKDYKKYRKASKYYIADARSIKYDQVMKANNMPSELGYLQIDLDVDNASTLTTLLLFDKFVFPDYKFATVTFEHDAYRGNYFNTRELSRRIFQDRGYMLLFADVQVHCGGHYCTFEDWYVLPDLADSSILAAVLKHPNYRQYDMKCEQIKALLLSPLLHLKSSVDQDTKSQ